MVKKQNVLFILKNTFVIVGKSWYSRNKTLQDMLNWKLIIFGVVIVTKHHKLVI